MSKRIFTKEQREQLLNNKNVEKCSERSITYNKKFKVKAIRQYQEDGMTAQEIFREAGFGLDFIRHDKPSELLKDWRRVHKREGSAGLLTENRGRSGHGGRPKTKGLTDKDKIQRLEAEVAYLKAENDFLAKLRAKRAE